MEKLVTIIVPIYNVEKYITKCLESIQSQTYSNIEVLLINDGTKDKSGQIAKEFCRCDKRFKYFEKDNGGLSSARNYGLKNANGEFIYFLDSDDWIGQNYIKQLVLGFDEKTDVVIANYTLIDEIIKQQYVPYKDCIFSKEYYGREKEKQILYRHINAYPKDGFEIKNTLMPVWKNMYRHSLLVENNLYFISEKEVGAEDYIFNLEAYYFAKKVSLINAVEYYHLIVSGSLSRKYYVDEVNRVINKHNYSHKFIENHQFYSRESAINALNDELCREIVIAINNFVKNNNFNSSKKIDEMLNKSECQVIYKKNKLNLERKYVLLVYILRHFKGKVIFVLFTLLNKPYFLYRKLLYINRK